MKSGFDQTHQAEQDAIAEMKRHAVVLIRGFVRQAMSMASQYALLKTGGYVDAEITKRCMKLACISYNLHPPRPGDVSSIDDCFDAQTSSLDKEQLIKGVLHDVQYDDFNTDAEYNADLVYSVENADEIFDKWDPEDDTGIFLKQTLLQSMQQVDLMVENGQLPSC